MFCLFILLLLWRCDIFKGDVTRDNLQRRVLAQHRVQMLEQCCSLSKRCRNNVISYLKPSVGASGHQSTFTFNGTFVRDKQNTMISLLDCQIFNIFLCSLQGIKSDKRIRRALKIIFTKKLVNPRNITKKDKNEINFKIFSFRLLSTENWR